MSVLAELIEQRDALDQQISAARANERQNALDAIKAMMAQHEFSCDDIQASLTPKRTRRSTGTPKYRDPNTGVTWTGKGRAPWWFAPDQAERFLIADEAA